MSLFSFFQKPAAVSSSDDKTPIEIISSAPVITDSIKPVFPPLKSDALLVSITPKTTAGTTETRKRIIDDEEEEEWREEKGASLKKVCTMKVPVDSGSEFSADDASESDSDDASDGLVDSDDEGYAPKSSGKKQSKKSSVTSKKIADPTPLKTSATTPYKTPLKTVNTSFSSTSMVTPLSNASYNSSQFSGQSAVESSHSPPYDGQSMPAIGASGVGTKGSHEHNAWTWLHPSNIRDKHGHRPDHPDYDPRTVKAPAEWLAEQTPGMRQWAEFKIENMDTVLFFKVGKFYELFHMDADVGMEYLDLLYMKGTKAHSGFPEISYGKYAMALVAQGFRVARVEQTETPEQLKERNDSAVKGKKKDKVVLREMCSILTRGTRTYCHLDDLTTLRESTDSVSGARYDLPAESILICIQERLLSTNVDAAETAETDTEAMNMDVDAEIEIDTNFGSEENQGGRSRSQAVVEYGVCCVDTVLNNVVFAQFHDDEQRTRLRTMISQFNPSEIVAKYQGLSEATIGAVRLLCPKIAWEFLRGKEMPTAQVAMQWMRSGDYFGNDKQTSDVSNYPAILQSIISALPRAEGDASAQESVFDSSLVMSAFGGVLWQLRRSLIDLQIISCGRCFGYVPPDQCVVSSDSSSSDRSNSQSQSQSQCESQPFANATTSLLLAHTQSQDESTVYGDESVAPGNGETGTGDSSNSTASAPHRFMTLDAIALSNLEILVNNYDKTSKGSLWAFMNHTKTAMGRRMLHDWVCKPLFSTDAISMRAAAVEDLLSNVSVEMGSARNILKSLPDLERLLGRIHTNGHKKRSLEHPDSRAVFFEAATHNTRKIKDFSDVLSGFEAALRAIDVFNGKGVFMKSVLLQRVTQAADCGVEGASRGKFPYTQMNALLQYYRSIFDEKQAKRDGNIKPLPGVDPEYDAAKADIATLETALQDYLREMKRVTNINELVYWGSNKDRFQIEVPISKTSRLPADWMTKSQKKTHRRFHTPVIVDLFEKLQGAENRMLTAQKDTLRRIFEKFDDNQQVWRLGVTCISTLDALMSLALVSSAPNYTWPVMRSRADVGFSSSICIENGRHPMLEQTLNEKGDSCSYIPNSVTLGGRRISASDDAVMTQTLSMTQTQSLSVSTADVANEYIPRALVLSGPNMGGKSTLLRQTCLIAIMAQIGCRVPADYCTMTPIDRIFTRVGASDKILSGQSTFYVELAETANILHNATENSLCILDELGRGTATFDGTAVAHAVLNYLINRTKCTCLFATHYHSLVEDWAPDPRVYLGHMDCLVEVPTSSTTDVTQEQNQTAAVKNKEALERVTFLYKLCSGSCPRSYGLNVARLAKLPEQVISIAARQSKLFEDSLNAAANSTAKNALRIQYNKFNNFYDKLLQIIQSSGNSGNELNNEELVYTVQELWRRMSHMLPQ